MNWNQLTPQQQQMVMAIMRQMMGGSGAASGALGMGMGAGTGTAPPPGTPVAGQTGLGSNPLMGNYMQSVMATQQPQLLQYLMGLQGGAGASQAAQQPSLAQLLQQQGSPMGGAQ